MGTPTPVKLYMVCILKLVKTSLVKLLIRGSLAQAKSFAGLVDLAAFKLDRSKPVQDHLDLVDRMLAGVCGYCERMREPHRSSEWNPLYALLGAGSGSVYSRKRREGLHSLVPSR